eukprot:scaffold221288_cov60-Attheya_sp.AAC.3
MDPKWDPQKGGGTEGDAPRPRLQRVASLAISDRQLSGIIGTSCDPLQYSTTVLDSQYKMRRVSWSHRYRVLPIQEQVVVFNHKPKKRQSKLINREENSVSSASRDELSHTGEASKEHTDPRRTLGTGDGHDSTESTHTKHLEQHGTQNQTDTKTITYAGSSVPLSTLSVSLHHPSNPSPHTINSSSLDKLLVPITCEYPNIVSSSTCTVYS